MQSLRVRAPQQVARAPARAMAPAPVRPMRRGLVVMAGTISSNDFRPGVSIEVDQQPYKVIEFLHVKPGKGAAFVRTKLKNFLTGNTVEKTFRAGEVVNTADVVKKDGQFTYMDGDEFVFMDTESYEETRLKRDDWAQFLKEGSTCELLFYNGKVISVEPPQFIDLKVVETSPNVKGNTAAGGSKPATLETGAVVSVPLFIEVGEVLKIDTQKGIYLSRA